jgi:hypothetical protein
MATAERAGARPQRIVFGRFRKTKAHTQVTAVTPAQMTVHGTHIDTGALDPGVAIAVGQLANNLPPLDGCHKRAYKIKIAQIKELPRSGLVQPALPRSLFLPLPCGARGPIGYLYVLPNTVR